MNRLVAATRFCGKLLISTLVVAVPELKAQEFRGLWVDSFHPGLRNRSEVHQLVADARAGNFNALFVEMRRRGDAFYQSRHEPKAADITSQNFDPLAELITFAHDTNAGPRLEIHAWIVAFNIWNEQRTLPSQANHPYRLHRDWLNRTDRGTTWDGSNFSFDPGHPEVQRHTFNVVMDLLSHYDVDGLQLDYIRYPGVQWGYNEVAVDRFKSIFHRKITPLPDDPQWLQFRRDQVTALVRKIYLSAIALRPQVKISAATIAWAPGITTDAEWPRSAAYSSVLQDWRAWMQEGILDLNVPMIYFRQQTVSSNDWTTWNTFAKDHRYRRHVAIGAAVYLNNVTRSLAQMRSTREATAGGNRADGVTVFSYATPGRDRTARADFLKALTDSSHRDGNAAALFAAPASPPEMPWKTAPTLGHLKGFVTGETNHLGVDTASLTVTGATNRSLLTDATGFFGVVDLPPGGYVLTAIHGNCQPATTNVTVVAGLVTTQDLVLVPASTAASDPAPAPRAEPRDR